MYRSSEEFWKKATLWAGCVVVITLMLVLIYW